MKAAETVSIWEHIGNITKSGFNYRISILILSIFVLSSGALCEVNLTTPSSDNDMVATPVEEDWEAPQATVILGELFIGPTAPTCGYQSGGLCGGTCPQGRVCYEVKAAATPPSSGGTISTDFISTGDGAKKNECKCVDPNDPSVRCKDSDPGTSGLQCGGACGTTSGGKPQVCYIRSLPGGQQACSCQADIADCKLKTNTDGSLGCEGTCSNGGCRLSADQTKCECGNTCSATVGQDGGLACGGVCQDGKLCLLSGSDCSCGSGASCPNVTQQVSTSDSWGDSQSCGRVARNLLVAQCTALRQTMSCPDGCTADGTGSTENIHHSGGTCYATCTIRCRPR